MALGPDDPLSVRALASIGRDAGFTGDAQRARADGERALSLARANGDVELVAHALAATLWQGMTPSLAPALLARAVELHQLGSRLGNDDHVGTAAFHRGVFAYLVGDAHQWEVAQRDLTDLALSRGQPFFRYVAGCSRYAHRFSVGDFPAAEHIAGWLDGFSVEFDGATDGSSGVQQFMLRRVTGGLEQARAMITGAEALDRHWLLGLLAMYTALQMWEPASRVLGHLCDRIDEHRAVTPQWAGVLAYRQKVLRLSADRNEVSQSTPDSSLIRLISAAVSAVASSRSANSRSTVNTGTVAPLAHDDPRPPAAVPVRPTLPRRPTYRAIALHGNGPSGPGTPFRRPRWRVSSAGG